MADDFDPSPRASKRQKTSGNGARRMEESNGTTTVGNMTIEPSDAAEAVARERTPRARKSPKEAAANGSSSKKGSATSRNNRKRAAEDDDTSGFITLQDDDMPTAANEEPAAQSSRTRKTGTGIQGNAAQSIGEESSEPSTETTTRSSKRQTRKPKKYADTVEIMSDSQSVTPSSSRAQSPIAPSTVPLRGILTPSGKQRLRSVKSVVFSDRGHENVTAEQLGFTDIRTTPKKSRKKNELVPVQNGTLFAAVQPLVDQPYDPIEDGMVLDEPDQLGKDTGTDTTMEDLLQDKPDPPQLAEIKSLVLARCTQTALPTVCHLDTQYEALHNLLNATITAGESNSLLLLGPRGSGKTLLVDTALKNLHHQHGEDFHTIRLSGFYQTDDRFALREIWRQLGKEMQVSDDELDEVSSYADTMASLLSLLSHPDELDPEAAAAKAAIDPGLKTSSKSIVFILDEFDLFTMHPRQTLLYNLFDIAQSRKAPIAVIGCSTRMDVVECLEKRVKSRYSHRWLHVPCAKSIGVFEEIVRTTLLVNNGGDISNVMTSSQQREWNSRWNDHMTTQLLPSPRIQALLRQHFHSTKSLPALLMALYPTLSSLNPAVLSMQPVQPPVLSPPTLQLLLPTLPTLHICLLTTSTRLETIHHLATLNFNLVHTHYTELVARARLQQEQLSFSNMSRTSASMASIAPVSASSGVLRLWRRETARRAWEDLIRWNLLVPVVGAGAGVGEDGAGAGAGESAAGLVGEEADARMYRIDVMLEEVEWAIKKKWKAGEGSGEVLGKWCREV